MNLFLYKDIHLAFRISVHLLPLRHFYVPLYRLMLKIVRISADFHGAEIMSLIFWLQVPWMNPPFAPTGDGEKQATFSCIPAEAGAFLLLTSPEHPVHLGAELFPRSWPSIPRASFVQRRCRAKRCQASESLCPRTVARANHASFFCTAWGTSESREMRGLCEDYLNPRNKEAFFFSAAHCC